MSNLSVLGRNGALVRYWHLMAKALEAKTQPDALQLADSVDTRCISQIEQDTAMQAAMREAN